MARTKTARSKGKGKQSARHVVAGSPRAGPSSVTNRQQIISKRKKSIKKRKKESSSSSLSDPPPSSSSKLVHSFEEERANAAKKRNRIRIDFDSTGSASPPRERSSSPVAPIRGPRRVQQRQQRNDPIQPLRFPLNPSREIIHKWLQKRTANPYVKLSNRKLAKSKPCSNLYFKFAKINPTTKKIIKLLPGGVLTRNEHPTYVMLRGLNMPKPFSVQLDNNQLYIRKSDVAKIEEEYEKNKIYQAVRQLNDDDEE